MKWTHERPVRGRKVVWGCERERRPLLRSYIVQRKKKKKKTTRSKNREGRQRVDGQVGEVKALIWLLSAQTTSLWLLQSQRIGAKGWRHSVLRIFTQRQDGGCNSQHVLFKEPVPIWNVMSWLRDVYICIYLYLKWQMSFNLLTNY